jgi:hypothetical protein
VDDRVFVGDDGADASKELDLIVPTLQQVELQFLL